MHHEMKEVGALLLSIQFYGGCARKKDTVPECAGSQKKGEAAGKVKLQSRKN